MFCSRFNWTKKHSKYLILNESTNWIQQFHQFEADESLVGDQCGVCLDDIEVGRRMMRLNCNGQHVFCQDCVEGWFADHNTCPNCRHIFT